MAVKSQGPDRAGEVLEALVARMEFRDRLRDYAVFPIFEEEVGPEIARRTEPLRIEDGKLFVAVESSAWMQELHFLKDEIRERLNRRVGAPVVREIFLVLGRAPREAPVEAAPEAAPEGLLDPPIDDSAADPLPTSGRSDVDAILRRIAVAQARRTG